MSDNFIEVVDAETKVSEVALPKKVTGYFAFYKNGISGKWDMVSSIDINRSPHPILPYWAFESRQEAVNSALTLKYAEITTIKIVAVEFEV